jgi:folate-binding protein YgfZ
MPDVVPITHRSVLAVRGPDRKRFLQGLVTNDVLQVNEGQAMYACFLTANGRFLHDFLIFEQGETLLLTPERTRADDLLARLRRYVLRAQVTLEHHSDWDVYSVCGDGVRTVLGFAEDAQPGEARTLADGVVALDPRHAALGAVALLPARSMALAHLPHGDFSVWDGLRITLGVPDGSRDLIPERAILLENNIDRLNGISWTKGCYMGQELTARTHYRGLVRKGLVPVRLENGAPDFDAPLFRDGAEVGHMRSVCGNMGLALVRLEDVQAGDTLTDAQERVIRVGESVPQPHPAS